jgi:Tfp pilus assembly protein PilF
LLQQGKQDDAEVESRRGIELDPKLAAAHYNLGRIMYLHHRIDEALAETRLAIELEPDNAAFRAGLGTLLRDAGRREDAVVEFRKAIAQNANEALYHALLGSLLSHLAQQDAAAAELQRALGLEPKLPGILDDAAKMLMDRASQSGSADLASANLIDACWLLVAAGQLAPDDTDRGVAMRRVDAQLLGGQRCPPS